MVFVPTQTSRRFGRRDSSSVIEADRLAMGTRKKNKNCMVYGRFTTYPFILPIKCFTTAVAAVVQVSVGDWKQTLTLRVELEHFLVKVKWMHSLAMWMLGTYPLTGLHMFVAFVQGTQYV